MARVAAEEAPLSPPRSMMYHRFPIADDPGNPPGVLILAVATVATLVRLRVPTLACCGMGRSRSPAIAAAALASALGGSPDDVIGMLAGLHPVDVSPGLWREARAALPVPVGPEHREAGRRP